MAGKVVLEKTNGKPAPGFLFAILILLFTLEVGADFKAAGDWQKAQEPPEFQNFSQQFVKFFNANDRRPWSPLLSEGLKKPGQLVGHIHHIRRKQGSIEQLDFKYFDRRKQARNPELLAVYLCQFSNGTLMEFRFGLDDEGRMKRLIFTDPNYNEALPELISKTPLHLPFAAGQQWYVLWGGQTEDMNYHVTSRSQRNAVDLLIKNPHSHSSHTARGQDNEDYYAFNQAVISPADGVVVSIIDGVSDNKPGEMNPGQLTGNTILIKTDQDEFLLLAHLRQGSISVSEGDHVGTGHALAKVGNSGNSSEPHLHMQLMDAAEMPAATGVRMRFAELELNGESTVQNYALIRTNSVANPTGKDIKPD